MNKRFFSYVIILALLCLAGCKNSKTENLADLEALFEPSLPPETTNNVNIALESFMPKTPYSALIQNIAIEALEGPDSVHGDYYDEATYLYTARVLETYRGPVHLRLEYRLLSEVGDAPVFDDTPYIVTLCRDEGGYFWPDIGANLPATVETVRKARDVGKTLDSKQLEFSDCE